MIAEIFVKSIKDATNELGYDAEEVGLEHPTDLNHGDYSSNVAMVLGKKVGKNPKELAEEIVRHIAQNKPEEIEKVEVAGPGFINFYLTQQFFADALKDAVAQEDKWGKNDSGENENIMLEYTSPNLFKSLHVGNLVGNIVGESLARLFLFSGANVKRINYPSDIGLTVAKGVWGLRKTKSDPSDIHALGEAYRIGNAAYEEGGVAQEEIEEVNRQLYAKTDSALNELYSKGIATSRARLSELCNILGTTFDKEIFESEAGPIGQKIVKEHTPAVFEESEGATVFKAEKYGLHTRVFLNSQGLPTYEAKDLGNFVLKQESFPNWTQSIVVTGKEQSEYFKVVIAAIREVFLEARGKVMVHVPTGFLTLTTGKMSSRKGNTLSGEEILTDMQEQAKTYADTNQTKDTNDVSEVVAVAALKYQILKHSLGSDIVFDKKEALSFEGDSGPYLQYSYVRTQSVLAKAGNKINARVSLPSAWESTDVERLLYRFPEIVKRAQKEYAPHYIVTFITELAGAFNSFYGKEKILDGSDSETYKLALTHAVAVTLKNGLWLLGIKAPERM